MRAARSDPGKLKAGTLALLVHAAFFTLLVFGVTWKSQQPAGVQAELWTSLPSGPTPPVVEKPAPPPEPPKQVQPEPKPEPKAEPRPDPQVDIALREEKLRKERQEKARLDEEKRRKEAEKKRKEEQALKEKQEREKAQKLAEQKAKAEKEAQAKAAQAAAAAGHARANDYLARIVAQIKRNTIIPPDLVGNPEVVFRVTLLPTGEILDLQLVQSSGFPSYDQATERAIRKSSPLPVPKDDPALFQRDFRSGTYRFRPNE